MAFNIVCVSRDAALEKKFGAKLDDLAFELISIDAKHFRQSDLAILDSHHPRCIVHFLPESGDIDADYIEDAQRLSHYASDNQVHFIQLSSFTIYGDQAHQDILVESDKNFGSTPQALLLAQLEEAVTRYETTLVIRISWLLNSDQNGVFARLLPVVLGSDKRLAVSDHNFGNPIHLRFLFDSIIAMVRQLLYGAKNTGVYHLCSADSASEAELADALIRMLNNSYDQNLALPAVAGAGDNRTVMPVNARLNATRLTHGFGIQLPTWRKGFKTVFDAWLNENSDNNEAFEKLKNSAVKNEST